MSWRILCAGGFNAAISTVDLSMRLEQLAVAGQRGTVHLWQCLTQTQAGTLDPGETLRSPVLLARYMPCHTRLISVHVGGGMVLIWDVVGLELIEALQTDGCPRASCAVWHSRQLSLLIFGTKGVTEKRFLEEFREPAAAVAKQKGNRGTKVQQSFFEAKVAAQISLRRSIMSGMTHRKSSCKQA